MKTFNLFYVLLIAAAFGCTKEGPEGPKGADGADGNANVKSKTATVSWIYDSPYWLAAIEFDAITQDIINTGAVLVYMKVGQGYNQIPLTFYQTSSYSTTIEMHSYAGGVGLIWSDSDLLQPNNPGTRTFKVVVIEASARVLNPDVDYSNYHEVKSAFNLEE